MPYQAGMSSNARLEALRAKHAKLSREIEVIQQRAFADDEVTRLKRQKLQVKEQIEGIA
jgi:hypothetical protein